MKCLLCSQKAEVHHLLTQKSYPEFKQEVWNKINVCREHHTRFHAMGTKFMSDESPKVKQWLLNYGWFFDENFKKWRPPIWV